MFVLHTSGATGTQGANPHRSGVRDPGAGELSEGRVTFNVIGTFRILYSKLHSPPNPLSQAGYIPGVVGTWAFSPEGCR